MFCIFRLTASSSMHKRCVSQLRLQHYKRLHSISAATPPLWSPPIASSSLKQGADSATQSSAESTNRTISTSSRDDQRRSGTAPPSTAALEEEVRALKAELIYVRLQLAEAQSRYSQSSRNSERTHAAGALSSPRDLLAALAKTDKEAHKAATQLRYTTFALQSSHDTLELELRRILSIGLTEDEVDAAAIECGARQFIRSNIAFNAEPLSQQTLHATTLATHLTATPQSSAPGQT